MGHWRGPHLGTAKVTPFPQPGLGAYKGTLWGPIAEFAGVKVAAQELESQIRRHPPCATAGPGGLRRRSRE